MQKYTKEGRGSILYDKDCTTIIGLKDCQPLSLSLEVAIDYAGISSRLIFFNCLKLNFVVIHRLRMEDTIIFFYNIYFNNKVCKSHILYTNDCGI